MVSSREDGVPTAPSPSKSSLPSTPAATPTSSSSAALSSRARLYRTTGESKWVTREIAALDFLLGIPMEKESSIVQAGYLQHQRERERVAHSNNEEEKPEEEEKREETTLLEPPATPSMKWWDKLINKGEVSRQKKMPDEFSDLEQPHEQETPPASTTETDANKQESAVSQMSRHHLISAPGRRLDGRDAVQVQIPLSFGGIKTRHRSIARQAGIREWELRVAHGLGGPEQPALLDGRAYFSNKSSYPVGVFSVLKYEPKKEEAARRRQKLEARGGGGTQWWYTPERDWRGTSYRALLPRVEKKNRAFHRMLRRNQRLAVEGDNEQQPEERHENKSDAEDDIDDDDDDMSSSSGESDAYVPGFLDDPEMKQGRHRHVMVGDRVTGCVVSSTIQFVSPAELKSDLNKQFRERFDGWEPPKSQRKYIGARVIDGSYTLMDPTEVAESEDRFSDNEKPTSIRRRDRQSSVSSNASGDNAKETIRMPPSLTLSKIRSVKQQALVAVVKADLEISTLSLACVYFERLCLDCRVDKSNRRLSFAACLLLAAKINESNIALVMRDGGEASTDKNSLIQSLIRPSKSSSTMFASLLEFFTHDWSISLKHLFAAEWGVFAALGFSLHASPSQVAFHFKRFTKVLGWGQHAYLGHDQYKQWQNCLIEESLLQENREKRRELRRQRQERNLLKLQRELQLQQENEAKRSSGRSDDKEDGGWQLQDEHSETVSHDEPLSLSSSVKTSPSKQEKAKKGALKLLKNRFSLKRQHPSMPLAMDKLVDHIMATTTSPSPEAAKCELGLVRSPSLPLVGGSYDESDDHPTHEAINVDVADDSDELMSDEDGIFV